MENIALERNYFLPKDTAMKEVVPEVCCLISLVPLGLSHLLRLSMEGIPVGCRLYSIPSILDITIFLPYLCNNRIVNLYLVIEVRL